MNTIPPKQEPSMLTDELAKLERFDCTSGGAQWCQGCYTMTRDEDGDYVRFDDVAKLIESEVLAGLAAQEVPAEPTKLQRFALEALVWIETSPNADDKAVSLCRDLRAALSVEPDHLLRPSPQPQAEPSIDLSQWERSRFGVFELDGSFRELPERGWESDPLAHTARWVGGINDAQLLRAALRPQAGPKGTE